jgi:hypothetical protein
MITVIASIAGFISSIIPEILKFFNDKSDKKHELEILQYQLKANKKEQISKHNEVKYLAQVTENTALYNTYKTNINWIDALNGTVRPVLAYSFFALYALAKYYQIQLIDLKNLAPYSLDLIWGDEDQAIFAGIISFYYGQRALSKIRRGRR